MIIKTITELGRRISVYTEKINKDLESTKYDQTVEVIANENLKTTTKNTKINQ